jgi:hypothetical protein
MLVVSWLAQELLASQEGLRSIELVSYTWCSTWLVVQKFVLIFYIFVEIDFKKSELCINYVTSFKFALMQNRGAACFVSVCSLQFIFTGADR